MPEILAHFPAGLSPAALRIAWHADPVRLAPAAQARLDDRWREFMDERQRAGRLLFNGAVTRLLQAEASPAGLTLHLGPADYKTFAVTCMLDHDWFRRHAPEAIAPALGNSVLLCADIAPRRALLGIRSPRVGAYPGRAHLIGGVAECLGTADFPASPAGLLAHLALELREEASLTPEELDPAGPVVVGLARDPFLAQPELIWRWRARVPLESIALRMVDAEHTAGLVLGASDVLPAGMKFTPVARWTVAQWAASG